MLKKIIYVVGSPRSGSSLIYNAVCSQNIFNPAIPENHLITNLTKNFFSQIKRNSEIEEDYFFESLNDTKKYFKNCLNIFFNKIAKKYSTKILVLKSITITSNINVLNLFYPEIFYIMTIRDPRDTVASMINVGIKQEKLKMKNQFPRKIEYLCNKINGSYRLLFDKKQKNFLKENVQIIKYEDFIENSYTSLSKIINKFSINIQYSKNSNIWGRSSNVYNKNQSTDNPYKSDLWNKPINSSRIGIYKDLLKKSEIDEISFLCKDIISIFNY